MSAVLNHRRIPTALFPSPTTGHGGMILSNRHSGSYGRVLTTPAPPLRVQMIVSATEGARFIITEGLQAAEWMVRTAVATVAIVPPAVTIELSDGVEDAEWLRQNLVLSMVDLAKLADVTRQAAYNWFNGSTPHNASSQKLAGMRAVFEGFDKKQLRSVRRLWTMWPKPEPLWAVLQRIESPIDINVATAKAALAELGPSLQALVDRSQVKPRGYDIGESHNDDVFRSV